MKRTRPAYLVKTTKQERFAKIARNPRAFQNRMAIVPYRSGTVRRAGFYGRYGQAAIDRGLIPEKKFFDTALSFNLDFTGECSTTAGTGLINLIPQGDTESTRDGRQCTIESINIRGDMTFIPGAAAQASGTGHLYLILDKQCNGALSAITDVFTSNDMRIVFHNLANSKRYVVLKKWIHAFNPPAGQTTAYNNVSRRIEYFKKCNIPIEFSSTTGAVAEVKSNNLFLAYGSGSAGIDDLINFNGNCRVRFRG